MVDTRIPPVEDYRDTAFLGELDVSLGERLVQREAGVSRDSGLVPRMCSHA